tara:strand:- start:1496 stop:2299 length:804 start_codon:yes stop_codon:yes gene_type:complete
MSETYNLLLHFKNKLQKTSFSAGKEIMKYHNKLSCIDKKNDNSPVTKADELAEEIILNDLYKLDTKLPVIAEEDSYKNGLPKFDGNSFWCIDALDGTKEFIKSGKNFTVNISLVIDRIPVLGIIYAPALNLLYSGIKYKSSNLAQHIDLDNNKEKNIKTRKYPRSGIIVLNSLHHSNKKLLNNFLYNYNVKKIISISSSLKFCLIAEGKADIYPRFGPTNEWDTAAGQTILNAAGGNVVTFNGKELFYNKRSQNFINDNFIASNGEI